MIGKLSVGTNQPNELSIDKALMKMASEINKSCPFMVDENIRADNVTVLVDNTIQYNYTLINYLKEEVDINQLKSNLSSHLLNGIKTNPNLKIFRDNKVTMIYAYRDKVGVFLFSLEYKYEDYKK
jgi:hypothetical protein